MALAMREDTDSSTTPRSACGPERIIIRIASPRDHDAIFRLRHEVYCHELRQYPPAADGRLPDGSVGVSRFILATNSSGTLLGFVAVTPPEAGRYGLEKYVPRDRWPLCIDDRLYEIRALTVARPQRGSGIASLLMYAALRWIDARGGAQIVAMGRSELLGLYRKCGLRTTGVRFQAGGAQYEILRGGVQRVRARSERNFRLLDRIERGAEWQLDVPLRRKSRCFHGGTFFKAIGEDFRTLERRDQIINADVLDAWYPPAPGVLAALHDQLPWLLRTSPPTHCEGLVAEIATQRGVAAGSIAVGAGSSDLMFRTLPRWVRPRDRVLILDPMYGEYAHILEEVVGCAVDRFPLAAEREFRVNLDLLASRLRDRRYAACFLVNPNSPTGRLAADDELREFAASAPRRTLIWIDETYVDFPGPGRSLETRAASRNNLVICKSMSKFYALSGARVGYLCGHPARLDGIRNITPPWVIGLPSQLAAVEALRDASYYESCRLQTSANRERLAGGLRACGLQVFPACANFLLARMPDGAIGACELIARCRQDGLFLRNASPMGKSLGDQFVRVAVKDAATCDRMVAIIGRSMDES
ncbi:MAG: aminotransferase class I/II-fold pyridoxal phosphate-dependent enzyme [Planctomycetes bacterium]|nr:aminotransferase class I/II-fold pyridoxal phosphate-dependent enzyme [Planctomycetota bacterium]